MTTSFYLFSKFHQFSWPFTFAAGIPTFKIEIFDSFIMKLVTNGSNDNAGIILSLADLMQKCSI